MKIKERIIDKYEKAKERIEKIENENGNFILALLVAEEFVRTT